jgi:TetR/AcrR family transcriptional regulator, transcriptional repressor for nem operon
MITTTRELLLSTAEKEIGRRGYAGFSFADLAKTVGIRKPSIHFHFPTKGDLGLAVINRKMAFFKNWIADIPSRRSAVTKLKLYARAHFQPLLQNTICCCAMLATDREVLPAPVQRGVTAYFLLQIDWLESVIAAGQKDGALNIDLDAAAEASAFHASILGAMFSARTIRRPKEYEKIAATCIGRLKGQPTKRKRSWASSYNSFLAN